MAFFASNSRYNKYRLKDYLSWLPELIGMRGISSSFLKRPGGCHRGTYEICVGSRVSAAAVAPGVAAAEIKIQGGEDV
jgi:hypothetical protein